MTRSVIGADAAERLAKLLVANHPYPGASDEVLGHVLGHGEFRAIHDGEPLCEEGDPGDEMWFLVRGKIMVQRTDSEGVKRELSTVKTPGLIGHMALIDRSRRSATCIAIGDVELVVMDALVYDRLIAEASATGSALRRLLLSSLCGQLAQANAQIRKLVEDLTEEPRLARPKPQKPSPVKKEVKKWRKKTSPEDQMTRVAAQLSGWGSELAELEKLEKEIELVVDEDQKRRRDKVR